MEKLLFLSILLCNALLEVRSLQCYVCDNCPKVKLTDIQTCGPSATGTTTATEPAATSTTTTQIRTTFTIPTVSPATLTHPSISSFTTTVSPSTSTTTTELVTTTEFIIPITKPTIHGTTNKYTVESTTKSTTTEMPITYPATPATEPSIPFPTEFTTISKTESRTESTTEYPNFTTEPTIKYTKESVNSSSTSFETSSKTPTSDAITNYTEAMVNFTANATEFTIFSTTESEIASINVPTNINSTITKTTYTTESATTTKTKESSPPAISSTFISVTQPIPTEPILTINYTTDKQNGTATNSTDLAIKKTEYDEDENGNNDLSARISRSLPKGCACEGVDKCDCSITYRSKRYALRGMVSNSENVKYTCVVDKYEVNGTEIVRRGCAILEEDQKASCKKAGFGAECKTCDTDQCNGASVMQCSAVFLLILYCVQYF